MLTRKVFLLLSGEQPNNFPDMSQYEVVCATDRAYMTLKSRHLKPDFIAGDFDSLKELPNGVETIHTPDQDFTDFHKILAILHEKGYQDIDVYGASGREQDHFLGNLSNAIKWKEKLKLTFFDNYGYYFLADNYVTVSNCKNKTVSLIPFPKATKIKTKGLSYPLNNEDLHFGERIGTRNKAEDDTIEISFESGHLFVFINNDIDE